MRVLAGALLISVAGAYPVLAQTAGNAEVDLCVKAAAATDHVAVKDVDRGACDCAVKELHKSLRPHDYDLHEKMVEIIASGADEKTFNRQMSDVMLARGMDQHDADAFLSRSRKAEQHAQEICNSSPLLNPSSPLPGPASPPEKGR